MAQIVVRNIPDDVMTTFRERARRHGTSVEAAVRSLIEEAVRRDTARSRFVRQSAAVRERLKRSGYGGSAVLDVRADRER